MKRENKLRMDFFIVGFIGVLAGSMLVLGIITLFEMMGEDIGFPRTTNVYINGSRTYESTVFDVLKKNEETVVHITSQRYVRVFLAQ